MFEEYQKFRIERRNLKDEYNELCIIAKNIVITKNAFIKSINDINNFYNRSYNERCSNNEWNNILDMNTNNLKQIIDIELPTF